MSCASHTHTQATISDFVEDKGFTVDQFFEQCRVVQEAKTMDEDNEDLKWFVNMLLSCTTYEKFHEIVSNALQGRETKLAHK